MICKVRGQSYIAQVPQCTDYNSRGPASVFIGTPVQHLSFLVPWGQGSRVRWVVVHCSTMWRLTPGGRGQDHEPWSPGECFCDRPRKWKKGQQVSVLSGMEELVLQKEIVS